MNYTRSKLAAKKKKEAKAKLLEKNEKLRLLEGADRAKAEKLLIDQANKDVDAETGEETEAEDATETETEETAPETEGEEPEETEVEPTPVKAPTKRPPVKVQVIKPATKRGRGSRRKK